MSLHDKFVLENANKVEEMMVKLGCDQKHISASHILAKIRQVEFKTIEALGKRFMYCFILMDNNFVAEGRPAAVISSGNWRDEIGQKVSFENAFDGLYQLEAYRYMSGMVKEAGIGATDNSGVGDMIREQMRITSGD